MKPTDNALTWVAMSVVAGVMAQVFAQLIMKKIDEHNRMSIDETA